MCLRDHRRYVHTYFQNQDPEPGQQLLSTTTMYLHRENTNTHSATLLFLKLYAKRAKGFLANKAHLKVGWGSS